LDDLKILEGETQVPAWRAKRRLDVAAIHGADQR
jgi:hypothetical protein